MIVRLPPDVSELTLRPGISSLKSPSAAVGANPAIKLPEAGVQVGVYGQVFAVPYSTDVEVLNCAGAELTKNSRAREARLPAILHLRCSGLFIIALSLLGDVGWEVVLTAIKNVAPRYLDD